MEKYAINYFISMLHLLNGFLVVIIRQFFKPPITKHLGVDEVEVYCG